MTFDPEVHYVVGKCLWDYGIGIDREHLQRYAMQATHSYIDRRVLPQSVRQEIEELVAGGVSAFLADGGEELYGSLQVPDGVLSYAVDGRTAWDRSIESIAILHDKYLFRHDTPWLDVHRTEQELSDFWLAATRCSKYWRGYDEAAFLRQFARIGMLSAQDDERAAPACAELVVDVTRAIAQACIALTACCASVHTHSARSAAGTTVKPSRPADAAPQPKAPVVAARSAVVAPPFPAAHQGLGSSAGPRLTETSPRTRTPASGWDEPTTFAGAGLGESHLPHAGISGDLLTGN